MGTAVIWIPDPTKMPVKAHGRERLCLGQEERRGVLQPLPLTEHVVPGFQKIDSLNDDIISIAGSKVVGYSVREHFNGRIKCLL